MERALSFLEAVAEARRAPRLKEVAGELGLNVATCYHLLNTLQLRGYITRGSDGSLHVGGRVALLYQGLQRRVALGRDLHDIVEQLSGATGETAYLSRYSRDGVVVQSVVEATTQAVRVSSLYVGYSGSEHVRASGKAVLAFLPSDERTALLTQTLGDSTVREYGATVADLEAEFQRIRRQGWAIDNEQFHDGVCCLAAPYFSSDGSVLGSVAISAPSARFRQASEQLTAAVCDAAGQVSAFSGHNASNGG